MKRLFITLLAFSLLLPHLVTIAQAFPGGHGMPECTHEICPAKEMEGDGHRAMEEHQHSGHEHKCNHPGHDERKCTCSHAFSVDAGMGGEAVNSPVIDVSALKGVSSRTSPFAHRDLHAIPSPMFNLYDIFIPVPVKPPAV